MGAPPAMEGRCDPAFAAVRDAFAENFTAHDEVGAAVAISVGGHLVVDLWGGWADDDRTRPWERDTIVDVFSVGKAMAALTLVLLADRGQLDVDAPVVRYWPEFGANGKESVTLRMLMSHRAAVPGIRAELPGEAMYDWQLMTASLAAEAPWWEPGERHGYHVNTMGFLLGEVVRRVTGESLGAYFRRELALPLGADFHFGIGPEHDERVAEFLFGTTGRVATPGDARADLLHAVYDNPPGISGIGTVNTRGWRAALHPSTNAHGNARAVARIYALLAGEGSLGSLRLLAPGSVAAATTEASCGFDIVLERESRFGLGFQLTQAARPLGPNPRSFGHFGAGGSLGFADPDSDLAFGYTMNRFGSRWQDPRNRALVAAAYQSL